MDTDDLVYCEKCGVYCHKDIVMKEQDDYDKMYGNFRWTCPVCKHENDNYGDY